jgi:hypothetical protein
MENLVSHTIRRSTPLATLFIPDSRSTWLLLHRALISPTVAGSNVGHHNDTVSGVLERGE